MHALKRTDAQDLADYKEAAEVLRDEVKRLRAAIKDALDFVAEMGKIWETEIVVNGQNGTAEAYRDAHGLSKDEYRDMVFELALYHKHEAPNGDLILDPLHTK